MSSLGQLLRQKYWQQDARGMKSEDTQDSNVLIGQGVTAPQDSSTLPAGPPPSYSSKTAATLPLDEEEDITVDDDEDRGSRAHLQPTRPAGGSGRLRGDGDEDRGSWRSPQPPPDLDDDLEGPVQSVEFSDDELLEPDYHGSVGLDHSDEMLVTSGSSGRRPAAAAAPVTLETAIDDDYDELIPLPPPHRAHHHESRDARARSPLMPASASRDASRHASPASSDASAVSHHLEHRLLATNTHSAARAGCRLAKGVDETA